MTETKTVQKEKPKAKIAKVPKEPKEKKDKALNPMKEILIEKVTVNIGVGSPGEALDNAEELLKRITGKKPVKTITKKRNPTWGLRKGLAIGTKVTMRGQKAISFLKQAFRAVKNTVKESSFDNAGNFAFGIKSYIDFPDAKYDPNIGMYGFDVVTTLVRRGYRIKKRKIETARVGKSHIVRKGEAINFIKEKFNVNSV